MLRTASLLAVAGLLSSGAVAAAAPEPPGPERPCPEFAGAMTLPASARLGLVCDGSRWQALTEPRPPHDRWISFGPEMTLHGEGRRNPEVRAGAWIGTPLDATERCRATQRTAVGPGVLSDPVTAAGEPGEKIEFEVLPRLFELRLSGYCDWRRVD